MAGLIIDSNLCIGCSLCINSCPSSALRMENKKVVVDENCILCGVCIDSCSVQAISIDSNCNYEIDVSEYKDIWVFAEQHKGKILDVSYELVSKAKELADTKNCSVCTVLMGNGIEAQAKELIARGSDKVFLCDNANFESNLDDRYAEVFGKLIENYKPDVILMGATGFGRSLAPRIAARVRTGLTADCTILEIDEQTGLLMQTRPAFGGNLMATIVCPNHRPQMASVRQGIMTAGAPDYLRIGEVKSVDYPLFFDDSIRILKEVIAPKVKTIADAEIIVAVGRGIGSRKNMQFAEKLAELIGGKVGVSRPLVDIGWNDYTNQIGQTGLSVSPKLLISCGVSGAIQHLAGIGGSEMIVAINTDPDAPIFDVAHYKIVGDCVEIIKNIISELERDTFSSKTV